MRAALTLQNCTVHYGPQRALDGVSLEVCGGETVGLVGANGSGKSTALAVAAGLLDPCDGQVRVQEIDRREAPAEYVRRIGYVPQEASLYDELTAVQNLEFFGRLQGQRGAALDAAVARALSRARLSNRADDRVRSFSGGMKQRLSLAVALLHEPLVLLLDEPTAALDAESRDALHRDLAQLREDGHAVLLTTHLPEEAEQICDRMILLQAGRVVSNGRPRELLHPGRKSLMYGHLREAMPAFVRRSLEQRLMKSGVAMEITGRRVRLEAPGSEELGQALALLLREGVSLESFRTPPASARKLVA